MPLHIAFTKHLTPAATQDFICSAPSCHVVDQSYCESISFATGVAPSHVHVKRRKKYYATQLLTKKCKKSYWQCYGM